MQTIPYIIWIFQIVIQWRRELVIILPGFLHLRMNCMRAGNLKMLNHSILRA